jgi:hypothetical protein
VNNPQCQLGVGNRHIVNPVRVPLKLETGSDSWTTLTGLSFVPYYPPVGTGGYSRITLTGLLLLITTLADETCVTPTIN